MLKALVEMSSDSCQLQINSFITLLLLLPSSLAFSRELLASQSPEGLYTATGTLEGRSTRHQQQRRKILLLNNIKGLKTKLTGLCDKHKNSLQLLIKTIKMPAVVLIYRKRIEANTPSAKEKSFLIPKCLLIVVNG